MSQQLENKIQEMSLVLNQLHEKQRKQEELFSDLVPILKLVLASGTEKLQYFEEAGYFHFAQGLGQILDQLVRSTHATDLQNLADSLPHFLNQIHHTLQNSQKLKPIGLGGLLKATRDQDVQKGLAVIVEILRQTGQTAGKTKNPALQNNSQAKLAALLAPKRNSAATAARVKPMTPPRPTTSNKMSKAKPAATPSHGLQTTAEGFLVNHHEWTKELAEKIAADLGIVTLTTRQWELINFSRNEYLATQASPNMRRMSVGSCIATKEIYEHFPQSPAKTICKIAGIPKPVGCI